MSRARLPSRLRYNSDKWVKLEELAKHISFFQQLPPHTVRAFLAAMRVEKVEIESIVFKEGDEGRSLSVLLNGSAAVFVKKPVDRQHSFGDLDDDEHDSGASPWGSHVCTLYEGDCLGSLSLLEGSPRTFTLIALEDMELATLHRTDYERILYRICDHGPPDRKIDAPLADYLRALSLNPLSPPPIGMNAPPHVLAMPDECRTLLTELVRHTKMFQMVDKTNQHRVVGALTYVRLLPGQVLFRQGDEADYAYFVVGGTLSVHHKPVDMLAITDREHAMTIHAPPSHSRPGHSRHPSSLGSPSGLSPRTQPFAFNSPSHASARLNLVAGHGSLANLHSVAVPATPTAANAVAGRHHSLESKLDSGSKDKEASQHGSLSSLHSPLGSPNTVGGSRGSITGGLTIPSQLAGAGAGSSGAAATGTAADGSAASPAVDSVFIGGRAEEAAAAATSVLPRVNSDLTDLRAMYGECQRVLCKGNFFGFSFPDQKQNDVRNETVIARETAHLAKVDISYLHKLMRAKGIAGYEEIKKIVTKKREDRKDEDIERLIQFVSSLKFFQVQSHDIQVKLCRAIKYERYAPDRIIFRQGDPGDCFYVLLSGSAGIHIRSTPPPKPATPPPPSSPSPSSPMPASPSQQLTLSASPAATPHAPHTPHLPHLPHGPHATTSPHMLNRSLEIRPTTPGSPQVPLHGLAAQHAAADRIAKWAAEGAAFEKPKTASSSSVKPQLDYHAVSRRMTGTSMIGLQLTAHFHQSHAPIHRAEKERKKQAELALKTGEHGKKPHDAPPSPTASSSAAHHAHHASEHGALKHLHPSNSGGFTPHLPALGTARGGDHAEPHSNRSLPMSPQPVTPGSATSSGAAAASTFRIAIQPPSIEGGLSAMQQQQAAQQQSLVPDSDNDNDDDLYLPPINAKEGSEPKLTFGDDTINDVKWWSVSNMNNVDGVFGPAIRVSEGGHSFGETALISDAPRGATIICRHETEVMTISMADYKQIFCIPGPEFKKAVPTILEILSRDTRSHDDIMFLNEHLKHMDFFNLMPLLMRRFVFHRLEVRTLPPNSIVFKEGDIGTHLYIIIEGIVGVHIKDKPQAAQQSVEKPTQLEQQLQAQPPALSRRTSSLMQPKETVGVPGLIRRISLKQTGLAVPGQHKSTPSRGSFLPTMSEVGGTKPPPSPRALISQGSLTTLTEKGPDSHRDTGTTPRSKRDTFPSPHGVGSSASGHPHLTAVAELPTPPGTADKEKGRDGGDSEPTSERDGKEERAARHASGGGSGGNTPHGDKRASQERQGSASKQRTSSIASLSSDGGRKSARKESGAGPSFAIKLTGIAPDDRRNSNKDKDKDKDKEQNSVREAKQEEKPDEDGSSSGSGEDEGDSNGSDSDSEVPRRPGVFHLSEVNLAASKKKKKKREAEKPAAPQLPADGKPVDFVHVFGPMACILGVGNMFGEEMIKHDKAKKQTTTIITREPTHMLMISRDTYLQTVRKIRKLDKQTKAHAKFLQVNPMFAGLPQSVLMHIARSMDEKTMKRGSVILKQGENSPYIYFLIAGHVKLTRNLNVTHGAVPHGESFEFKPQQVDEETQQVLTRFLNKGESRNFDIELTVLEPYEMCGTLEVEESVEATTDRPRTATRPGTAVNPPTTADGSNKPAASGAQISAAPASAAGAHPHTVIKERPQPLTGTYTALSEVHLLSVKKAMISALKKSVVKKIRAIEEQRLTLHSIRVNNFLQARFVTNVPNLILKQHREGESKMLPQVESWMNKLREARETITLSQAGARFDNEVHVNLSHSRFTQALEIEKRHMEAVHGPHRPPLFGDKHDWEPPELSSMALVLNTMSHSYGIGDDDSELSPRSRHPSTADSLASTQELATKTLSRSATAPTVLDLKREKISSPIVAALAASLNASRARTAAELANNRAATAGNWKGLGPDLPQSTSASKGKRPVWQPQGRRANTLPKPESDALGERSEYALFSGARPELHPDASALSTQQFSSILPEPITEPHRIPTAPATFIIKRDPAHATPPATTATTATTLLGADSTDDLARSFAGQAAHAGLGLSATEPGIVRSNSKVAGSAADGSAEDGEGDLQPRRLGFGHAHSASNHELSRPGSTAAGLHALDHEFSRPPSSGEQSASSRPLTPQAPGGAAGTILPRLGTPSEEKLQHQVGEHKHADSDASGEHKEPLIKLQPVRSLAQAYALPEMRLRMRNAPTTMDPQQKKQLKAFLNHTELSGSLLNLMRLSTPAGGSPGEKSRPRTSDNDPIVLSVTERGLPPPSAHQGDPEDHLRAHEKRINVDGSVWLKKFTAERERKATFTGYSLSPQSKGRRLDGGVSRPSSAANLSAPGSAAGGGMQHSPSAPGFAIFAHDNHASSLQPLTQAQQLAQLQKEQKAQREREQHAMFSHHHHRTASTVSRAGSSAEKDPKERPLVLHLPKTPSISQHNRTTSAIFTNVRFADDDSDDRPSSIPRSPSVTLQLAGSLARPMPRPERSSSMSHSQSMPALLPSATAAAAAAAAAAMVAAANAQAEASNGSPELNRSTSSASFAAASPTDAAAAEAPESKAATELATTAAASDKPPANGEQQSALALSMQQTTKEVHDILARKRAKRQAAAARLKSRIRSPGGAHPKSAGKSATKADKRGKPELQLRGNAGAAE